MEDKAWAQVRLGPDRIRGALASFSERSGQLREGFHCHLSVLDFEPFELGRT